MNTCLVHQKGGGACSENPLLSQQRNSEAERERDKIEDREVSQCKYQLDPLLGKEVKGIKGGKRNKYRNNS